MSTGRKVYANAGFFGINSQLEVGEGYDSGEDFDAYDSTSEGYWTVAERKELADYMISLWTAFRDSQSDAGAKHE